MERLILNGDQVGRDDPDRATEPQYVGHYLIVSHENCLEYVAPFIEWRRKSGWKVDIYSVPDNQSRNTAAIKRGIQDRYDAYLDNGADPYAVVALADSALTLNISDITDSLGVWIDVSFPVTWWVQAFSELDTVDCDSAFSFTFMPDAINSEETLPVEFGLRSIYPSPFNSLTRIKIGLDRAEEVRLGIYDLQGRVIRTLLDQSMKTGYHEIAWNAVGIASGVYIVRLETQSGIKTAKIALIR